MPQTLTINSFKYFYPERPRLLQVDSPLVQQLSKDKHWIGEEKFNGNHLQLHYYNGIWQFWGRHGELLTYKPNQEVMETLDSLSLSGNYLFDGELRHNKVKGIQHKIVLWDVFISAGTLLTNLPYWGRREILGNIIKNNSTVLQKTSPLAGDFAKIFEFVIKNEEIEGLVLKNLTGMLQLGRNRAIESNWMYKIRKVTGRHRY